MDRSATIGVVGAGTMGSGIAQVAAQAGHAVLIYDERSGAAEKSIAALGSTFDQLVAKGKFTKDAAAAILVRLRPVKELAEMKPSAMVIEAVVEDPAVKKQLFAHLETITGDNTILATNTSSLSVTSIASACHKPERVIGLHFFNPAPILPLVEVVPGLATQGSIAAESVQLMHSWGKLPVQCKDTPGFIVNRVARPFYGEAIRIFEEGLADKRTIDRAMKEVGGFKMGPFELMDLIGNDVNFTVTKTVWECSFYEPRFKPSITQQRMVEAGWLGRKSGRGYYRYDQGQELQQKQEEPDAQLLGDICWRIVVMLINEAADALHLGIASRDDIDLAMTKGVNYPKGLLKWADEKGLGSCLATMERLQAEYGEDRYRPSPLLRRMAREQRKFW